jgi:hypothetical protein
VRSTERDLQQQPPGQACPSADTMHPANPAASPAPLVFLQLPLLLLLLLLL